MGAGDKRLILGASLLLPVVLTVLYFLGHFDATSGVKAAHLAQAHDAWLPHPAQVMQTQGEAPAMPALPVPLAAPPATPAAAATAPPAAGRDDIDILPNGVAMLKRMPSKAALSALPTGSVSRSNGAPTDVVISPTGEMTLNPVSAAALAARRSKALALPPNSAVDDFEISPTVEVTRKPSAGLLSLTPPSAPSSGADDVEIGPAGVVTRKRPSAPSSP